MEAAGLGLFMLSAAGFCTLLEHPDSPLRAAIVDPLPRRVLMGLAMGLTCVALVYSPWGRRSGAHLNPALTLVFARLGKVALPDTAFYVVAQFAGGAAGLFAARVALGPALAAPQVDHVATRPGTWGPGPAFVAEVVISFVLMLVVLWSTNSPRWAGRTGWLPSPAASIRYSGQCCRSARLTTVRCRGRAGLSGGQRAAVTVSFRTGIRSSDASAGGRAGSADGSSADASAARPAILPG